MFYYRFPASRSTFQVTGTVDSSGGGPVSGATVTVNPGARITTTNGSGVYTIRNLPSGSYTIDATKSGFDNYSSSFDIAGKNLTKDFVMTLQVYSVSGTVTSAGGGQPLNGVTVSLDAFNAVTAIDGTYTITGVTSGLHAFSGARTLYNTNSMGNLNVTSNLTGQDFTLTPTVATSTLLGAQSCSAGTTGSGGSSADVGIAFTPSVNIMLTSLANNSGGINGNMSNLRVIAESGGPNLATATPTAVGAWTSYSVTPVMLSAGTTYIVCFDIIDNVTAEKTTDHAYGGGGFESYPGGNALGVASASNPYRYATSIGNTPTISIPTGKPCGVCDIGYSL